MSTDVATIANQLTGSDGPAFLRDITSTAWDDGGRHAGELFAWIPRDAQSSDPVTATRAGESAHVIASFIADLEGAAADVPANPGLWQAFAHSMAPYTGAMVGDPVKGFHPLDGTDSQMRRTTAVFAAMARHNDVNRVFADAASRRAHSYEAAFAKAAVAEPLSADRGTAQQILLQAARLRSLVAAGAHLANPGSEGFTPAHAQTEVAYQVASLTARSDDPHIDEKFFRSGRLLSPGQIADTDWSIYDSQLTVYLTPWPRINHAIEQFGRAYDTITRGP
ncbi:hypothetical protein [Mycolicibacterium sp. HK-90]|uniref:hypothetical protein n=1 Tax=Mycolicibacterium sp. HK-90 TaxID=3056937 RepID=UPI002659B317|nr:hypothetical protein [Mycolicibacterium sp. HK-90]WKG03019.1 hypothetical protein QU592_28145 [Mycolicibacterium sp. HK-90]